MGAEAGLVFFVVVVAVAFYWILLRPVIVQQRRQRSDIQNLEVGDEVLTQAGFIARVKDIRVPLEEVGLLPLHPRFFAAAQNDSGRWVALYARGWLR